MAGGSRDPRMRRSGVIAVADQSAEPFKTDLNAETAKCTKVIEEDGLHADQVAENLSRQADGSVLIPDSVVPLRCCGELGVVAFPEI